jgi:DNA-binding LacI/PurR family transcriptional regulator
MERQSAFITRVAELGMILTTRIEGRGYTYDAGRRSGLEIAARQDTDAIFFANDILATGGIDALREEAGLRVPEDVSVAGFDDIAMAGWPRYALTTYGQPVDEIVGVTVKMIEDGSCQPGQPALIKRLPGRLIIRQSTAPLLSRNA